MSIDQRLAKLKGHVLIFSHEFRDLIEIFEMLVPVAQDRELLKTLSETKRKSGIGIVRWSLVQTYIIGLTKLVYDQDSRNPTIRNLIEAIVDPQSLRDKLRDAFSIAIKPASYSGNSPTEGDLTFWKEVEKIDVEGLRQNIDRYLPELDEQWQWFSQHEEVFKELRDKRFATLT